MRYRSTKPHADIGSDGYRAHMHHLYILYMYTLMFKRLNPIWVGIYTDYTHTKDAKATVLGRGKLNQRVAYLVISNQ